MAKPFFYRITAADFLAAVVTVPEDQRAAWVLSLALDMVSGDYDRAQTQFAKDIIVEAGEFSEKKRQAAKKRWSAKDMQTDAVHSTAMPVTEAVTVSITEPITKTEEPKIKTPCAFGNARRAEMFQEFWDSFEYKKGKAGAEKSWKSIKLTETIFQTILSGAKREAQNRPALTAKGSTPKMAQGWLTEKRWEDEHEESGPKSHRESTNLAAMQEFVNG